MDHKQIFNINSVNKSKILFIDQPRFLGDIIYVMGLVQHFIELGYKVLFPIEGDVLYIKDLSEKFPMVTFINTTKVKNYQKYYNTVIVDDTYAVVPFINTYFHTSMLQQMKYKYLLLGYHYDMWTNVKILRNKVKEDKLMDIVVGKNTKYDLYNINYKTNQINDVNVSPQQINIPTVLNGNKRIDMQFIYGYSLFDWITIMENADNIYTVHTSIQYLLELYIDKPKNIHIFNRPTEPHSRYNFLFKKKYIYK